MTTDTPAPAAIRRMVAVFGLCGFAASLATRALDPLMAELARDFSAPHGQVALLATAFALPYALVQPVLGPVGDALGKRRIVTLCAVLLALMLALCALAPGLSWLFAARVASGLAAGGIFPLTLALFGDSVPLAQRQVAISRVLGCSILGQLCGGILSGLVAEHIGWRGVMAICAAVAVLAFLVLVTEARGRPRAPVGPRPRLGDALR
ncbi:MFS transporter, partial [Pseudoroseomonas wenyumeiae]